MLTSQITKNKMAIKLLGNLFKLIILRNFGSIILKATLYVHLHTCECCRHGTVQLGHYRKWLSTPCICIVGRSERKDYVNISNQIVLCPRIT